MTARKCLSPSVFCDTLSDAFAHQYEERTGWVAGKICSLMSSDVVMHLDEHLGEAFQEWTGQELKGEFISRTAQAICRATICKEGFLSRLFRDIEIRTRWINCVIAESHADGRPEKCELLRRLKDEAPMFR